MNDIAIIGGGIVGLATALALTEQRPGARLTLLEKEPHVAAHQTGHNSGVIHAGIYYKPGTLKARLCVSGARRMIDFCEKYAIPYERCGKLIVATSPEELPRLDVLVERAAANGVSGVERVGPERLREIEPFAAGLAALHSPNTAIVDYKVVARTMRRLLEERGVVVRAGTEVTGVVPDTGGLRLLTPHGSVVTRSVVNCAGLYADRVARLMGVEPGVRVVPFRGEYYFLQPHAAKLVHGLIYPVADPALPFLGVHFTKTVDGRVEAGPNAVLAFAREGYRMRKVRLDELGETLTYMGFWRLARRFWRTGGYEFYRSLSRAEFVRSLQKLVPDLRDGDIERGGAGVRAQAVSPDGHLVDDFHIVATPRALHVLNAPSPAATASLVIGEHIAVQGRETFGLTG